MSKNIFNIWASWLTGTLLVFLTVVGFYGGYKNYPIYQFLDKITYGDLFQVIQLNQSVGLINPLAILNIFIYGFILGWILYKIFK